MQFGHKSLNIICKLGVILLAFCTYSYADKVIYNLPVAYLEYLLPTVADLTISAESAKLQINRSKILLNSYVLCAETGSELANFINDNSTITVYSYNSNKSQYSCILSRPGSKILQINSTGTPKKITLNLKSDFTPVNIQPGILELISSQNLAFSSPLGESQIPLLSTTSGGLTSLPQSNMLCRDPRQQLENYVLDLYQPTHLRSQVTTLTTIPTLQDVGSTHKLADEMKTPYQPLPTTMIKDIQPLLLTISINGNRAPDSAPELVYASNQVACLDNGQLLKYKVGDNHHLFYEYFQPNADPLVDSSLKCIIEGKNNTQFTTDQQAGVINFILPVDSAAAQNINLGVNN
ncbi:MAG: hypothetical protein K2Q03_10375, partial [Sphingobacteriaceae bacterium]|nr:hypothetical protein [Sphingobacteriaceae bacterium]